MTDRDTRDRGEAPAPRPRPRGALEFAGGEEGDLKVVVSTIEPIRLVDDNGKELKWAARFYREPAQLHIVWGNLPNGSGDWTFPTVIALVSVGMESFSETRVLDLSRDSPERQIAERLLEQRSVVFEWKQENLTHEYLVTDEIRRAWETALKRTANLDAHEYREMWIERELTSWGRRARSHSATRAEPPAGGVRYFCPVAGELPRDGAPTLAGVELPFGRQLPDEPGTTPAFWASDGNVAEDFQIVHELAAAFSETGLWPLVWTWSAEPPDAYLHGKNSRRSIDRVQIAKLLRKAATAAERPDLLPSSLASGASDDDPADFDPTDTLRDRPLRGCRQLLLIPCNRPADVFFALGMRPNLWDSAEISAICRSWEDRFGAVPVALQGVETIRFAVARPPQSDEAATALAQEMALVSPSSAIDPLTEAGALRRPWRDHHLSCSVKEWNLAFE